MTAAALLVSFAVPRFAAVWGAEYYVDSRTGSDLNSGVSPEQAWKSIDKVNGADLKPGDVVRFRRNGLWRGKLVTKSGSEGKPIVYSDYGTGAEKFPPRIVNSVDLSGETNWKFVSELSGTDLKIWGTREPEDVPVESPAEFVKTFAQGKWHIYTEEDAKATFKSSKFEDVEKSDGYTLECVEPGARGTYMQLTTQGFPVRAGYDVEFSFLARASSPCNIGSNISVFMSGKPWTSYANKIFSTGEVGTEWKKCVALFHTNADAEDGRMTFFIGGALQKGTKLDFIPLGAREVQTKGFRILNDVGNLVLTEPGADSDPNKDADTEKVFASTFDKRERCGFKRWTMNELKAKDDFWYDYDTRRVYFVATDNPGKLFESIEAPLRENCCVCGGHDVVIENITFSHTGSHGISLPKTKRGIVRNCSFDWIGGGDLYNQGGGGKRVRYGNGVEFWDGSEDCLVEKCRFSRVYDVAITTQGPELDVSRNLVMRDCLMYRCEQAFEIWFTNPETVVEGLVFENNLCVDCGRDWSHIQRPNKISTPILGYGLEAKKVDITIRNNVFCESAQFFVKCWHNRIGEYKIDDNVYWVYENRPHENGDRYFGFDASHGKKETTFEDFRKETGHDQHSRWVEPKFKDYEHDDFTLMNALELNAGPRVESWTPLW